MPALAWWQWAVLALCALLAGMAKSGLPGLGFVIVPTIALAIAAPEAATGWLLPLLIVADLFALGFYRREARIPLLLRMAPWVVVGMIAGYAVLELADGRILTRLLAILLLAMIARHLLRARMGDRLAPRNAVAAAAFGVVAGFATTVSNAAGPVMVLYFVGLGLSKGELLGTSAWFFAVVNLAKVVPYAKTDPSQFSAASLAADAVVAPAVVAGSLIGRRLQHAIPQRAFEVTVMTLATVGTLALLWKSLR